MSTVTPATKPTGEHVPTDYQTIVDMISGPVDEATGRLEEATGMQHVAALRAVMRDRQHRSRGRHELADAALLEYAQLVDAYPQPSKNRWVGLLWNRWAG